MEEFTRNEMKVQDFGMLPVVELLSRDSNSKQDSSSSIFQECTNCRNCKSQRTLSSHRHHKSALVHSRSHVGCHSFWRTFNELGKLSKRISKWQPFTTRILIFVMYFIAVLSRLLSSCKYGFKRTFFQYILLLSYGVLLLTTYSSSEDNTFMSQRQGKLLNSFVPVGMGFVYKIPNKTFNCDIERLEVSEGNSRTLPHWLAFDEVKQQFYGVPSIKDTGNYEILVVALARSETETGKICGMRAFTIYVSSEDKKPINFQAPVLESISVGLENPESQPKASEHFVCVPGLQAVLATVVVSTDIHKLGGHERMGILRGMAQHMGLSSSRVALFDHENGHPLISQLEDPSVVVSGAGDGRFKKGPKSILTWKISCGAMRLGSTYLSELETNAQDGTLSNLLGYPVVRWHVTSGVQKARHRARRAIAGASTPTPTASIITPTQLKNISTMIITEGISLTTLFLSPNSTLMPSLTLSSSLQVSPTSTVLMSSTPSANLSSTAPITSATLNTTLASTPALSSVNLTSVLESTESSSVINDSSPINSTTITRTANSTSVILSTEFKNITVVASSATSTLNVTSISSTAVLNSTSVLEIGNSTSLSMLSSTMGSTFYSVTPSPTIFIPENSSVLPNSTVSTLFNFSTTSLNQTTAILTSVLASSAPVNSTVTSRLNSSSATTVIPSSVVVNSTVFMNQTSSIQPSFQTSSFPPPSPTMTSNFTLNVTSNLTSMFSASLMVSNTSVVMPTRTSNATEEDKFTSIVNSSSLVSVVPSLSTVPVMTTFNMSTSTLLPTVMNTSLVYGVPTSLPAISSSDVLPSSTDNVTMSTAALNTSSLVMMSPSSIVMETQTPYPTVTASNVSTIPLSSSLTPPINTSSSVMISPSSVVMETQSTVVMETQTPYPTMTLSNMSTVPLSSSPTPLFSTSSPAITSSVSVSTALSSSPNFTSDILNLTKTTSLVDEMLTTNLSSLVPMTSTVNSTSRFVFSSSATPSALLTTSLFTESVPSRSVVNSTVMLVHSSNVTTLVATSTTISLTTSSSVLEETSSVLVRNNTTSYVTATTLVNSSVLPSASTSSLNISTSTESTASPTSLIESSVLNTSVITSTTLLLSTRSSMYVSLSTSRFETSTSVFKSEMSTMLAPSSSSMVENSTFLTPSSSELPQTSSSPSSSILVSSAEVSTVSLSSQASSSSVSPTTATATPNLPPKLQNDIGRLTAIAGKVFRYVVPQDVFHDEDGNTRSLSLTLKLFDEELKPNDITNDFWLKFDAKKQEMYGLPMEKDAPSDPEKGVKFLLTATDSSGLIAYDAFEIMITKSTISNSYTQSLSMRLLNNFTEFKQNVSQRIKLVSRISSYYGDPDTSQVRVLSYSEGSVLFSWTNDSLPSDVCNTSQVNYVAEKVVGEDGSVTVPFREHLAPEYSVTSANRTLTGVCNATIFPPPLIPDKSVGSEPSGLWEKHVLPGIIVAIILIILAILLLFLVLRRRRARPSGPEKRTYKKRKPIILEPEMEMKPRSGKPLILENDELSHPPSYMSEMSLDKTLYYDSDDSDDYKNSLSRSSPLYETPPPVYQVPREPFEQPPPTYRLPPSIYSSYTLPPWETSSDV